MLENIMNWLTNGKVTPGAVLLILLAYSSFLWIKNKLNISRDKINNLSARRMQIESYFKQQGGEDQRKIYIKWVNLLINFLLFLCFLFLNNLVFYRFEFK